MAGAVRIGLARGAENNGAERRASTTTILASVIAIGLIALPVAFRPEWVASLYFNMNDTETLPVFQYVVIVLPLAAGFMFFDAVITGISYWIIGFPIAYYTALHTDFGAKAIWYGLTAGLVAASIGLGIRLWLQLRPQTLAAV